MGEADLVAGGGGEAVQGGQTSAWKSEAVLEVGEEEGTDFVGGVDEGGEEGAVCCQEGGAREGWGEGEDVVFRDL